VIAVDAWLYIALLGAVILGYAWMLPKPGSSTASANVIKDIEEAMDHFSSEMEEENRQLMNVVTSIKSEHEVQVRTLLARIEYLEKHSQGLTEQVIEIARSKLPGDPPRPANHPANEIAVPLPHAEIPDHPAMPAETPGMNIRTRYSELFQLAEQGKSIDHIAKKLGMNKGEVMLIMQLAKQEERARV
jgi:DNA-binding NarL/FixJ family response regulator